jgi:hypothetical protein
VKWTGPDAPELVRALDRPLYLSAYMQAIYEHKESATLPDSMLDVIEGTHDTRPTSMASRQRCGSFDDDTRGRDSRLS